MEYNNKEKTNFISYKVNVNNNYFVYKKTFNGKDFYKVLISKKNYDGTKTNFYKNLKFCHCKPPEDGTMIKIKRGFEDLYKNDKDPYNAISVIVVLDYEAVESRETKNNKAYSKFHDSIIDNENDDEVFISDDFLD